MWAVGAGLGVIGSVFSNLGVNVQKYSFMKNARLPTEKRKPYWRNAGWWIGLALVVLGALGDFIALGIAAQSIVAPIGAMTLVANIFFAHYWLKESLPRKDLFATAAIITGSVVCAVAGDHTQTTYSLEELLSFYSQPGFIVYAIFVIIFVGGLYGLSKRIEPIKVNLNKAVCTYEQAKAAGQESESELRALDENILAQEALYAKWEKIHPFTYCAISGAFGGQNILFGKMVAELLARTFSGDNQMIYFLTYVFVACMFLSIFFQLHFLAKALSSFDALYCVPVFQCFFIVFSTLAGAAYFSEFARFNITQSFIFPIGMILTLGGVYVLSSRKMRKKHASKVYPDPSVMVPPVCMDRRKSAYASGKASVYYFQRAIDPTVEMTFERTPTTHVVADLLRPEQIPNFFARVASLGHTASFMEPPGLEATVTPFAPLEDSPSVFEELQESDLESTTGDLKHVSSENHLVEDEPVDENNQNI